MRIRKRVYFIHGFDPRGNGLYYRFFRKEKPDKVIFSKLNENTFTINEDIDFVILDWHKLVRNHWFKGFKLVWHLIIHYLKLLTLISVFYQNSKIFLLTSLYPAVIILLLVVLNTAILCHDVYLGLYCIVLTYCLTPKIFERTGAIWISRNLIFYFFKKREEYLIQLSDKFAQTILQVEQFNPAEEIVIVAHSNGAYYIVSTIAKVLRQNPELDSKIIMLTLGSCMPNILLMRGHHALVYDDFYLIANSSIVWHDLTEVTDGLCFFKVNMYKRYKIEAYNLYLHSIPVHKLFSRKKWIALQINRLQLHFSYFVVYDNEDEYKYNFFDMIISKDTRQYLGAL